MIEERERGVREKGDNREKEREKERKKERKRERERERERAITREVSASEQAQARKKRTSELVQRTKNVKFRSDHRHQKKATRKDRAQKVLSQ